MTENEGKVYGNPNVSLTKGQMNYPQTCFFSLINALFERISLSVLLKIEYLCQKNTVMPLVYLGLGSNLGDKDQNLNDAVRTLSQELGKVLKLSTFYTSDPWGYQSKNGYLNAVVLWKHCFRLKMYLLKRR